jgi:hypothetical protein
MPIVLSTNPAGRFAVVTFKDPYTIEEWREATLAMLQDPVYRERSAVLIDLRQSAPMSAAFVAWAVDFFAWHTTQVSGMGAAVVVSDEAGVGMGRMTELRSEFLSPEAAISTFRSYVDAVRWLTLR